MGEPPDNRASTDPAAAGFATPRPRQRTSRLRPATARGRAEGSVPGSRGRASATARGLALVALAVAAAVIAAVVSTGGSSPSRSAQSVATRFKTVTVTGPTRVTTVTRSTRAPQTTSTPAIFVPLRVSRFGFTTEIPAGWQARTQRYPNRQRVSLSGPGGATIVIDRTAHAPSPAQLDHGDRTVSLTPWRGAGLSGTLWRFAAPFCHPVCSDWIGASPHAGYAVLIYSADPTLIEEATVVASRLHDQR